MRHHILTLILLIGIVMIGCSGGGNPVTPDSNTNTGDINDIPIIALTSSDDGTVNAIGVMGEYELIIDPVSLGVELVSKRTSTLGESWIVSGVGFFTISPCTDCFKVDKIALTAEGYLQLTFAISHPFDPGILTEPPTWKNRLDLDVFDVALVIVPIGAVATDYLLTGTSAYTGILVNNAGYTTELTNVVGDRNAMPYALVIDDNTAGGSTNNKFPMGIDTSFEVLFDLANMTSFTFDTYLTMGYGWSAKKPQRLAPRYCIPEFNRKCAWKVIATPPNGSDPAEMWNSWNDTDNTTLWDVTVEVFDWQQGANVDPALTLTTDIYAASDVARVSVEIPGMTNTLPSETTPISGTGSPTDPLVYVIPIANENLLGVGEYFGLVKVTDERIPQIPLVDRDYLIDVPDGIVLNNHEIPEFATYQTFVATVVLTNIYPVALAVATTTTDIIDGQEVTFDATASYDPDGTVDTYEWDFNEDGIFAGAGDEYTGNPWNPTHAFPIGDGSIEVQLKVTDNLGGTDQLDSPIIINIVPSKNKPPRPGINISDITTIRDTNEVLLMFVDNQVWKYDARIEVGSLLFIMPGMQLNQRIEANNNGDSLCGWWSATARNTYSYYYNGTLATAHNYTNLIPRNNEHLIINAGTYSDYQSDLSGYDPLFPPRLWMHRYAPPTYANAPPTEWDFDYTPGTGGGNLDMNYVKGSSGAEISPQFLVLEGAPEFRVERLNLNPFGYLGTGWGGIQTDSMSGFWNPQDITSCSPDNIIEYAYVLDILSTGAPTIKKYTWAGGPIGQFGSSATMPSTPSRIEASWASDWIYVSMADAISIFLPNEQP